MSHFALDFIAAHPNWYIFPIAPNKKYPPLFEDNLEKASNDPRLIAAWIKNYPGCNFGLSLAKSKVICVDVDRKPGKVGEQTFDALTAEYDNFPDEAFPPTLKVLSPSGGWHLYYNGTDKVSHRLALGKQGFGEDIDSPNYVLIPGCTLEEAEGVTGGAYAIISNADVANAPAWFADKLRKKEKSETGTENIPVVQLDQDSNISWYINWLRTAAPSCIQGSGGEKTLLDVAAKAKDRGISPEQTLKCLTAVQSDGFCYNAPPRVDEFDAAEVWGKCDPPWSQGPEAPIEDRIEAKIGNAWTYLNESAPGAATPEAEFADTADEDRAWAAPRQAAFKEAEAAKKKSEADARDKHPWIYIGATKTFLRKADMWELDTEKFDAWMAHMERGKASKYSKYVLEGQRLRTYERLDYRPGEDRVIENGRVYNTYRESDLKPVAGDTTAWDEHLAYLWPDAAERAYVLNWLSWLIQARGEKPMHALLMAGLHQGTGKSFIGWVIGQILGERNVSRIAEGRLESSFNEWAKDKKLLVIEELKSLDRGKVKLVLHDLITEKTVQINEKNRPCVPRNNCFGLLVMTNEEAAIQLDNRDRRWLVVRTNVEPKEQAYYTALFAKLKDRDFLQAVYHQLDTRDTGTYKGTDRAPMTSAKAEMVEAGLSDLEHCLLNSRDEWPLNQKVCAIEDIRDKLLSPQLQRTPRLYNQIGLILKTQFQGERTRAIINGKKKALWAINGSGVAKIAGAAGPAYLRTLEAGAKVATQKAANEFGEEEI